MPATVHYKDNLQSKKLFEQIAANFVVENDGYISITARFVATSLGLTTDAVQELFPKPNSPIPKNLLQLRGFPENEGIYANKVNVVYANGLQFVEMTASSCLTFNQYIETVSNNTLNYSGSVSSQVNETTIIAPYRFTLKIPNIKIATAYLSTKNFPEARGATVERGRIQRSRAPSLTVNGKKYKTEVINAKDRRRGLRRADLGLQLVETISENSDGSITRGTKAYTLQVVDNAENVNN